MNKARRRELAQAKTMIIEARDILSSVAEREPSGDACAWIDEAMSKIDEAEDAIEEACR